MADSSDNLPSEQVKKRGRPKKVILPSKNVEVPEKNSLETQTTKNAKDVLVKETFKISKPIEPIPTKTPNPLEKDPLSNEVAISQVSTEASLSQISITQDEVQQKLTVITNAAPIKQLIPVEKDKMLEATHVIKEGRIKINGEKVYVLYRGSKYIGSYPSKEAAEWAKLIN